VLSLPIQLHVCNLIPGSLPVVNQLFWLLQSLEPCHSLVHSDDPPFGGIPVTLLQPLLEIMMSLLVGRTQALHMALSLGWVAAEGRRCNTPLVKHSIAWVYGSTPAIDWSTCLKLLLCSGDAHLPQHPTQCVPALIWQEHPRGSKGKCGGKANTAQPLFEPGPAGPCRPTPPTFLSTGNVQQQGAALFLQALRNRLCSRATPAHPLLIQGSPLCARTFIRRRMDPTLRAC
jgi:hypothetical protein